MTRPRRRSRSRGPTEKLAPEPSLPRAEQAEQVARSLAERLAKGRIWGPALGAARPGPSVLVQRLDETDGYYFIVPFSISSRVTARIAVDWRTNRVVEVAGVDTPDKALPSWSFTTNARLWRNGAPRRDVSRWSL